MSLNKTPEHRQGPKCSRCGYHGIIVRIKGHARKCPFLHCRCWKCALIQQRSRITAVQRRIDDQSRGPRPNLHADAAAPATDKREIRARGAADAPAEEPLDLRTRQAARRGAVTDAGCQVLPQVRRGPIEVPNGRELGPHLVAVLPQCVPCQHARLRIPCVVVQQVAPPPPPSRAGAGGAEA